MHRSAPPSATDQQGLRYDGLYLPPANGATEEIVCLGTPELHNCRIPHRNLPDAPHDHPDPYL